MIRRGRGRPQILVHINNVPRRNPKPYAKKWDKDFSKRRGFGEKAVPQVDELEEIGANEVDLTVILRTFKGEVPSYKVKFIQNFCQEVPSPSPESTNSEITEEEPQAWIDDRDSFTALARTNPPWLKADELYAHLKLPRFGLDDQPNADRRLICVKNLGAPYIRALAETASFHQIETLREAFWNYLALKASLKVKICAIGFKTLSLEINMPYLALRYFRTPSSDRLGKPTRKRIDLSFLNIPTHANDGSGTYGLQEAHLAISIIGVDHYNWTCYCFVDTDIGGPFPDDEGPEDEEEDPDDEIQEPMKEDPIVCDDGQEEVQNAHSPVWDPREYFLLVVDVRMKQILREWENVVYEVEAKANYWMDTHPFTVSSPYPNYPGADVEKDFDWIIEMIVLLRRLLGHLSEITRVWERFVTSDGDIGYFSDIKDLPTRQRLDRIRGVFDDLIELRETLEKLNNSCETRKGNLELLSNLEGNRLSRAGNDLNYRASVISWMSHKISLKSHNISLESHNIGLKTVEVSRQNHKIARFALVMSQILAPVGIVVAYFGTQNNIFLFDRNLRSFIISLVVVTIGFNLIGLFIYMIGRCGWLKDIIHMSEQPSNQRMGSADENNIGMTSDLSQDVEMNYLDGEARRREFAR